MKDRIRKLTDRRNVYSYEARKTEVKKFIVGWVNYFKLANMKNQLKGIDEWMRRRIRMDIWKMWKKPKTRYTNLKKLGLDHDEAMKAAMSRKEAIQ